MRFRGRALGFSCLVGFGLSLALGGAMGCGSNSREQAFVVSLPEGLALAEDSFGLEPARRVKEARLDRVGQLFVTTDGGEVVVRAPGLCPVTLAAGAQERVTARALLDFGPAQRAQVGYDADVEIRVRPGCDDAKNARIAWAQVEGPSLARLSVSEQGRRVSLHTLPVSAFFGERLPEGVVAVSPRTQGRYVLEASATLAEGTTLRARLTVTSIARSTGLFSLAPSQRVMLGTKGLTVRSAPRGSGAQVERKAGVDTFAADVAGRYVLSDGVRQLELTALPHERTPLDCGRSECHAAESEAATGTAMSHALARVLAPHAAGRSDAVVCALECHVVGEAGVHDGGFVDVARSLGFSAVARTKFADLPTALRRLGAVRCTACHGPGAIPAREGRARILRVDVCASCHDAPPTYAHVEQWSLSRMARADVDERTREEGCARCHTTGGFLDALGVRKRADRSRDPDDAQVGISCAACHAAHGEHLERALVRRTATAPSLAASGSWDATASALCSQCHAPSLSSPVPEASSAALWLGRVAFPESLGGGVLEGPGPHAAIPGGCLGCHGAFPAREKPGTGHSFAVDPRTCASCHEARQGAQDGAALREQARVLLSQIAAACGTTEGPAPTWPTHAAVPEGRCRASRRLLRARYAVLLVAEDGAASQHNRPFCEQILEEARRALRER